MTKFTKRNRIANVAAIVAAVIAWLLLAVVMGFDHQPADGAVAHSSGPCVGHRERGAFTPQASRLDAERRAGVVGAGVNLHRVDDTLIHGVAYLTCSGKRFVVLYFNDDETVASVIVA